MIISILVASIVGFCISVYAFITERKIKADPNYKPACDITDRISCSRPLQSEYSNLFFFSNTTAGLLFYAALAILAAFNFTTLILVATSINLLVTLFLAYLLFFKIKSLCPICISLYIVNITMFVFAILAMSGISL
ncbi:hypothetical protein M1446_03950 [Candidatus Dependentiae bacterium]|nr:hypothetical protein [Candidatus Dependentiae bacterium]